MLEGLSYPRARGRVIEVLSSLQISDPDLGADSYPHRLAGGMRQRVCIGMALATKPDLIGMDEPTTNLDVTTEAEILDMIADLKQEHGATILFISHDLGVASYMSDHMAVMYLGTIVELGPTAKVLSPPDHPYTEALLSAISVPDPDVEQKRTRLRGPIPSARDIPSWCRFHTRCPRFIGDVCVDEEPPRVRADDDHLVFCHIPLSELRSIDPVFTRWAWRNPAPDRLSGDRAVAQLAPPCAQ